MSNNKPIKSAGSSAEEIIEWGKSHEMETCFDRADKLKPCPIGETGACCRVCHMGPCRLVGKNAEEEARGVCGARLGTVAARNFLRMIAAGTSAHSDHSRDMANTLLDVATGKTKDFKIKDVRKLYKVAGILEIDDHPCLFFNCASVRNLAELVASECLNKLR